MFENKLKLLRKFLYFMIGSNFFYQLIQIKLLIKPEIKEHMIIQVAYWVLWLAIFALILVSKVANRLDMVYPSMIILLIRNLLPMLDFDLKRLRLDQGPLNTFIIIQVMTLTVIQVCINFVSPYKVAIPITMFTNTISIIGVFTMSSHE